MTRTEKRLLRLVGRASREFNLLEPGDKIMVCLSGGKDSYAMMRLLDLARRRAPFAVELVAVNLDQGHPGFEQHVITQWCDDNGYSHHMIAQDTHRVVKEKIPEGSTFCSLCSRLRRGILYQIAHELGATKVALGHHKDDTIETLLLNLFFSGQIKAMPPRLTSDDGRNVLIRPLIYCAEEDIEAYTAEQAFPVLPCGLCGSQDNLQRQRIKRMLAEMHSSNDNVKGNLFAALANVKPTHLMDRSLRTALGIEGADALLRLEPGAELSLPT